MKKRSRNILLAGVCAGGAALTQAHPAFALEHFSPFQVGVTAGFPTGALPPPGLYFSNDIYFMEGNVVTGQGKNTGVKIQGAETSPMLMWVPNIKILGARYSVGIMQPFALNNTDENNVGGASVISAGLFNMVLFPEKLSWDLGRANFVSEGLAVYLPTGDYHHTGTTTNADSYANNFTTFEPSLAYSYLGHGWDVTLNNVFDFNTKNKATDYHSGSTYYLDWTVAHSFGKLTLGAIGNYTQQFTDDTQFGKAVENVGGDGYGNRYMHVGVGVAVEYQVGSVLWSVRYIDGVAGANGGNPSFVHFGVSFPLS
ncbi:SphA family protein [Acidocella sp.]|uniref:SphA family protein n=1 Tax=Acidocella sp. TaxID=50710 RepID=UPI003D04A9AB